MQGWIAVVRMLGALFCTIPVTGARWVGPVAQQCWSAVSPGRRLSIETSESGEGQCPLVSAVSCLLPSTCDLYIRLCQLPHPRPSVSGPPMAKHGSLPPPPIPWWERGYQDWA